MKNKWMILILFLITMAFFQVAASALWDEAEAVHIQARQIENATLAIGTHLIYIGSLTEEIYKLAQKSAEDSAQTEIYYKSELAGGAWFQITTASTLADITTGGVPVEEKTMEELFFTHHTKSNGITYDLRTGKPVNLFDIHDPYDLEAMPELAPLKSHYDTLRELQSENDEGKKKIKRAEKFFDTEVETDKTKEYDKILIALQTYLDLLKQNNGGAPEISAVESVMKSVDASRRTEVFQIVEKALTDYAIEQSSAGGEDDDKGDKISMDTLLQSATADSLTNVGDALTNALGNMLDKGTTVLSANVYQASQALCQDAISKNHSGCDSDLARLLAFDNILNGVTVNQSMELGLLKDVLLVQGESKYAEGIRAGENEAYRNAVAQKSASVLLRSIADEYTSQVNTYRSEFEFFIEAYCMRINNQEGQKYLEQRLVISQEFYSRIKKDAFESGLESTVDKHIEFLSKKKRALELAAGGNELDKLIAQKSDLQMEQMAALDKNDLAEANEQEKKIIELDSQISVLSKNQIANVNDLQEQCDALQKQLNDAISRSGQKTGTGNEASSANVTASGNGDVSGSGSQSGGESGNAQSSNRQEGNEQSESGEMGNQQSEIGQPGVQQAGNIADIRERLAEKSAELAAAKAGLADGSLGAMVIDIKSRCLDAVNNQSSKGGGTASGTLPNADIEQNVAGLTQNVEALGDMLDGNYKTVFPALKEIYDAMVTKRNLEGTDNFDNAIGVIEKMILNSNGAFEAAMREEKSKEDLNDISESFFGKQSSGMIDLPYSEKSSGAISPGSLDGELSGGLPNDAINGAVLQDVAPSALNTQEREAVKLAALAKLVEETGNENALALLTELTDNERMTRNPLVFDSFQDGGGQYVSVSAIAQYANMRYVWLKNKNEGTLANGFVYYTFTGYSDKVLTGKDKVEYMTRPAVKKGDLYIPGDYAAEKFAFQGMKLPGSNCSVLLNSKLRNQAEDLYSQYLDE